MPVHQDSGVVFLTLTSRSFCSVVQTNIHRVRRHSQDYMKVLLLWQGGSRTIPLVWCNTLAVPGCPNPEPVLPAGPAPLDWRLQQQDFTLSSRENLRACWQLSGVNINYCFLALRQGNPVRSRSEDRIQTISTQVGFAIVSFHYLSLSQLWRTQRPRPGCSQSFR